ncbi:MAG: cytochrome c maturation protein CcmE [Anaerolineae bacterium]|jgi:cytochrome c-type biogenesis protein CcmE|nr:cytochrome c maturation protein CcmE [Anaerolineae bacterium]
MAQAAWEKPAGTSAREVLARTQRAERLKFLIGGVLLLGVVLYLVFSGTLLGARYFISIDEAVADPQFVGQTVRVTGVVLGDTITIDEDSETTVITFTVAAFPQDHPNLAEALHLGAQDPNATRMQVRVVGQPKPELLRHEAQAIMSGKLDPNGVFIADELNFKCPSRFEGDAPVMGLQDHPGMERMGDAG